MSDSPRIVTEDVHFLWDGVAQRLPKGQVMDVPPGSALEAAIGRDRLRPLGAVAAQPPAEETAPQEEDAPAAEPEEPPATPRKAAAKAKDDTGADADKDGGT